jgi:guanylate kinase
MSEPLLFVITGVSGGGKSTLISHIIEKYDFSFSISYTTRKPREGEEDKKDYYFIDEKRFKRMIEKDEFIEWANVYGNLYGTSKKEINELFKKNKNIILDLDIQGTNNIKKLYPDSIAIFILTKSIAVLKERLLKRGERDFETRVMKIKQTIEEIDNYDYLLINDKLDTSYKKIESIIEAESMKIKNLNKDKIISNFWEK